MSDVVETLRVLFVSTIVILDLTRTSTVMNPRIIVSLLVCFSMDMAAADMVASRGESQSSSSVFCD